MEGNRMGFAFKLEREDGAPADLPTLKTVVPNWSAGDTIALGSRTMLRVVDVRDDDADQAPLLVVEGLSPAANSEQAA
jgi:hypothetical protein